MPENPGDFHHLTLEDLFVKDAFLVFRALCKLTMKPLNTERSVNVRYFIAALTLALLVKGTSNLIQCDQNCYHCNLFSLSSTHT
jgi:hypothetical protein